MSGNDHLLHGLRVVDLAGEPALATGRILADLGAEVVRVVVPVDELDPAEARPTDSYADRAWNTGKAVVELSQGDRRLTDLVAAADVVIDTPGWPGTHRLDRAAAPNAVWVSVTPFGEGGPRGGWRAADLGVMAASGNMFCTGDPDRAPLRCAEPTAYAHTGPEAAFAALTALASGYPQHVDVSMQEAVLASNIGGPGRWARERDPGQRRGANIGRTREIWPCRDGYVSFGIRGGKARIGTWTVVTAAMADEDIDVSAFAGRDWSSFNHNTAEQDELDAIAEALAEWFARHTKTELYELACEHNLTLAPINGPREIEASEQLRARGFLDEHGLARRWVHVRSPGDDVAPVEPRPVERHELPEWRPRPLRPGAAPAPAWSGTRILEFGSGAAGPIATRYFVEHGATVVRVESTSRPDFLRAYALGPKNPHGLDGAPMFDALNVGKLSITLDLKHPEGRDLALRLVDWADAVSENFAPKAMRGLGLDYDSLVERKPDLVMVSACLNGQTGPHKDYPGFGSQGAALAGFNYLTGWPDREPVGPFGTITDSLAPRFVATALAAGLLYRRRTGKGVYLDISQVEVGSWTLAPWLLRYAATGEITGRMGNRSPRAVPHGAFPCRGDDRWITLACWTDREWTRLAAEVGLTDPELATFEGRRARIDEVEKQIADWTSTHDAVELAERLQALGLEAVPVQDFGDVYGDPQLGSRAHFVELEHANLGPGAYERHGFRLSATPDSSYDQASPLLGEHNAHLIEEVLGISSEEHARLREVGALD